MKMHIILALTTIVSSVTFGQTLKDAIRKTDNERFAEANNDFKKLIAAEPSNGTIYFYAGENYQFQGELDSALILWKKAYDVQAISPLAIVSLGKSQWISGDEIGAKAQFATALKLTKNKNAEVIRAIAGTYIYSKKKNLEEAIALLQIATKLDSKNEDGFLMLGDALIEKNPTNGSEAIISYNQVLDINSKSPRGIVRVAKVYQRAQNFELANEKYKEAQTIDPTYAPAYRENAELNMRFNQPKKAIENWKKYLKLNNTIEARYRYATAMFLGKQYCEAIEEINNLNANGFTNFYTDRMLGYSYVECTTDPDGYKKGLRAMDQFFANAPADKIQ
jgi:tetratricopeptide (TPR) repeat protein